MGFSWRPLSLTPLTRNFDDATGLNSVCSILTRPYSCHCVSRYTGRGGGGNVADCFCDGLGCTCSVGATALRMHLSVERQGCQRPPTIERRGQARRRQAGRAYWWISGWTVLQACEGRNQCIHNVLSSLYFFFCQMERSSKYPNRFFLEWMNIWIHLFWGPIKYVTICKYKRKK